MNQDKTIFFIHGLWMTPRSWELFRGFYEQRGYRTIAPAWPRMKGEVEELRRDPSALAGLGVTEIADHYEKLVRRLDEPPVLVGHSFGGLIVQILLDRGLGAAGISVDGVPPKGVLRLPFSAVKAASAVLRNPANYRRTVMLTYKQFRYGFANVMSESDARAAYERYAVPGPGRPIFQVAFANLDPNSETTVDRRNSQRAPLLLIAGTEDHQVPPAMDRENLKRYEGSTAVIEYKEFPGRSHLIMAQAGWQEVAEFALSWAEDKAGWSATAVAKSA